MLIIDNMPHSFGFQIENGIPIIGWHNDPHDCELKYLARYLVAASHCEDLRMYNSQLKLLELLDYSL
jgi:CTD small phosphatase-like protein 2